MNVAAVQQHFRDVSALARRAGASEKVAAELNAVAECLAPFAEFSVGDFAAFLRRADEYSRTGVLPVIPPKVRAAARPPKLSAEEMLGRFRRLYDGVLSPSLTGEAIEAELAVLDGLKKADVLKAAEHVGIAAKVKKMTVADVVRAVKQAVRDRRGMFERPSY